MIEHKIDASFLIGENALYVADVYGQWVQDAASVSKNWAEYFSSLGIKDSSILLDLSRGSTYFSARTESTQQAPSSDQKEIELSLRAASIADAYRRFGHFSAKLDPLNLQKSELHSSLDLDIHNLSESDLDQPLQGYKIGRRDTIRGIIEQLSSVYCESSAFEYMHIHRMDEVEWIKRRLETAPFRLTEEDEKEIYSQLVKTELFEHFLAKKFPGAKRFGVEGVDALIPMLLDILHRSSADELGDVVIGMAHRGRLNMLYNVMGRSYEEIFAKFLNKTPEGHDGHGDVKYHVGANTTMMLKDKSLNISLLYNPSHLEAVNPVVMGNVWAKQQDRSPKALGILVHGDAAFPGQGVNSETMLMSQVEGYGIGGMLHIITNNQIGFTANPNESRSTEYSSDLAKSLNAPVFHVNADDIPACIYATWLAYAYRQEFKRDVVIDLIGYRRFGHNEGDEPNFTQPIMYEKIRSHPSVLTQYEAALIEKKVLTSEEATTIRSTYKKTLTKAFETAHSWSFDNYVAHDSAWKAVGHNNSKDYPITGVALERLKKIGEHLSKIPENCAINPKIVRQLESRKEIIEKGEGLDWACGELLAYGSLLEDGIPVRLSGEDSIRGTFSHRHAGLFDQHTNQKNIPLNELFNTKLDVYNSVLSEYGVMGFEYGVALSNPNRLVVWEAQFGDFANGAQIIIDQFIASAETKWEQYNGLVLLLPHALEGQGPEHSSARLERFLQLCAEDNMRVAFPSTPASIFHLLRRQVVSKNRKPLIVMTPKSLLRHKLAISSLSELSEGTAFQPVLSDTLPNAKRVVLCSGKIYYELLEARKDEPVALIRLEELYPFPKEQLKLELEKHPHADIVCCQEEPQNMGAWQFVYFELKNMGIDAKYIGRPPSATPASGYTSVHQKEQARIIEEVFQREE